MTTRREALLNLAEPLLEELGPDAFGLGVLARAANIKTPSLYKHFSSAADLEHALISRGFTCLAEAFTEAALEGETPLARFARLYRHWAHERPALYQLMMSRPLDHDLLEDGVEEQAMSAILAYFGENTSEHPKARVAWAAAHGLVALELAGRFTPGANLDETWIALTEMLENTSNRGS
ncbi:MAG: TetR/AcrR family transcriptional regulator [Microbacteriaceae bacterium]